MEFRIADVKEKEIDFLLAEEFASSPSFTDLFLSKIDDQSTGRFTVNKVYRSHTDTYGESDLEVYLSSANGKTLILLIENKIAAQFQSDQLIRYKQRGDKYLRQGTCDAYKIILVAPQAYSDDFDSLDVDAIVFYEELKDWYNQSYENADRAKFKTSLLERALQKATQGYQLIEDETASKFWKDYWKVVNEVAPILNMPTPGKKPSGSSFIYFYPPDFPSRFSLIHKFTYGNIDLQIANVASKTGLVRQSLSSIITDQFTIQQAGKSAVIRKKAPVLDLNRTVESQLNKVTQSIHEVNKIYKWYLEHKGVFQKLEKHLD